MSKSINIITIMMQNCIPQSKNLRMYNIIMYDHILIIIIKHLSSQNIKADDFIAKIRSYCYKNAWLQ